MSDSHRVYSETDQRLRAELHALIRAEQRACTERCMPYIEQLAAIEGRSSFVMTFTKEETERLHLP